MKYYSDEGFVEHKIELGDEDLEEIIREYLERHAEFDFDEVEVVNNRPMNIWFYAKCRKYVDPDASAAEQEAEASQLGAEEALNAVVAIFGLLHKIASFRTIHIIVPAISGSIIVLPITSTCRPPNTRSCAGAETCARNRNGPRGV